MEANMFTGHVKRMLGVVLPAFLLGFAVISVASIHNNTNSARSSKEPLSLTGQIRHELLMLPYFGVFDNLGFTIEDSSTAVLTGQVVRPILKSEAEAAVGRIQGISKVVDNIEMLPLSSFDDAIRLRTYRAIFSRPGFEKYANQASVPIRIIVKNGNITLDGFVGSRIDKTVAAMAARSVPGAFSVTDNLIVD
jgi:hyperosmotically inducible periplasmic protein